MLNVGERISPVPSGASSVVTSMSPTSRIFAEKPRLPELPAFVVIAK